METSIIITKNQYNALMAVKPTKDIRYYLNSIHLNITDFNNVQFEATNGHRLLIIKKPDFDSSTIKHEELKVLFNPVHKATGKVHHVELVFSKTTIQITFLDKNNVGILTFNPEIIEANFPDCNRVIPREVDKTELKEIGINPAYLLDVSKLLADPKFPAIKMQFYSNSIKIEYTDNTIMIVMSVRV